MHLLVFDNLMNAQLHQLQLSGPEVLIYAQYQHLFNIKTLFYQNIQILCRSEVSSNRSQPLVSYHSRLLQGRSQILQ